MNICLLSSEYPPGPHGGEGTFTQLFARALQKSGHQVRVAGVYPVDYPAPDYAEDEGVQIWRLREHRYRGGWIVSRWELFRLIKKWIAEKSVDIVEAPDFRGWFAGWPKLSVPLVQRAHGSYSYFAHEMGVTVAPSLFRLEHWSYRRADSWVSVSQYTGDITTQLFKLKAGPRAIMYNPIVAPATVPPFSSRTRHKVVFTGTLTPKKGVISLIRAWPQVIQNVPQAELHLYGKDGRAPNGGMMIEYLSSLLPEAVLSSVNFHGHVTRDTIFEALSSARVTVLPSFSEAFALAPLEAMAHGCPTIYTSLGSGPESISDGTDGLLVDPNYPHQIAEAIVKVLEDESLAAKLSDAGRLRATTDFSLEKLLPLNEKFYRDLIHSFNGNGQGKFPLSV